MKCSTNSSCKEDLFVMWRCSIGGERVVKDVEITNFLCSVCLVVTQFLCVILIILNTCICI